MQDLPYSEDICLPTVFLSFSLPTSKTEEPFVSTATRPLVGTLTSTGNVTDIFPITECLYINFDYLVYRFVNIYNNY